MTANARHMIGALLLCAAFPVFAQMTEHDVRTRLDAVYAGKGDEAARELPALLRQHPNDPGVLYIQAVLTSDGALAVKRYQDIADRFPQSVWADDALYKVYQYHFSIGLYKKADMVMEQLRSRYPQSIYATGGEMKGPAPDVRTAAAVPAPAVKKIDKNIEPMKPSAGGDRSTPAEQTTVRGKYYVQAGVFSAEANARMAAEKYGTAAGRQAVVMPRTTGDKKQYLVLFDGFDSAEGARSFSTALKSEHHIDSFVFPSLPNPNPNGR